ncbi:hypothetical protein LDFHOB_07815 [Candidatus Electronema aureum]
MDRDSFIIAVFLIGCSIDRLKRVFLLSCRL